MTEDFYDLLEISPEASQEEISSAYREKVRDYHPDVNDDDRAQAQFTALTKANDILSDPVERQAYDRLGHGTYVAKRTSGIPSPDVWSTNDDGPSGTASGSASTDRDGPTDGGRSAGTSRHTTDAGSSSRTTGSTSSQRTGSSSSSRTSSRSSTAEAHSQTDAGTEPSTQTSTDRNHSRTGAGTNSSSTTPDSGTKTGSDGPRTGETGTKTTGQGAKSATDTGTTSATDHGAKTTSRETKSAAGSNAAATGSAGSTSSGTTGSTARAESRTGTSSSRRTSTGDGSTRTGGSSRKSGSTRAGGSSRTGGSTRTGEPTRTDNGLVRWWRRRNVAMPLLWCSLAVYVAGIAHYALAHTAALAGVWTAIQDGGLTPTALWETLSSSRYGLETPLAFVTAVDPLVPSLEALQWYGLLVGIVAIAGLAIVTSRFGLRSEPSGPITMDETIVLALGLGLSTGLYGGPLLAGAVLLPLLFGIVVHHTRRLPGWTPSYLYVVPVLGPAAGLGLAAAGYVSLPLEVLAFVAAPLVGGCWLPVRATIRKHLGR